MTQEITIRQIDTAEHEKSGSLAVQQATEASISCNEDRELAAAVVMQLNSEIAQIEREFDGTDDEPGPVRLAHKAWKAGVALREKALYARSQAKLIWTQKIRKFEFDVEQARLAEARRLQKEAEDKARKEREDQIKEAKRLGDREGAENLKAAPIHVEAVAPVTPEVNKVEGLRRSNPIWTWEVADAQKVPCKYHTLDEKAITAVVKRLGPRAGIPGITVYDARSRGNV